MLNDKKFKKDIDNLYRLDKNYDVCYDRNIYENSNSSNYFPKSKSQSISKEREIEKECANDLKQIDSKLKSNIYKFENSFSEQFDRDSRGLNSKLNSKLMPANNKQSSNISNISNSKILKSNKTSNIKSKYPVPKNIVRGQDIPTNNLNKISPSENNKNKSNFNTIQTTPYEVRKLRAVSDSPTKHSSKYDKYMTDKLYSKLPDEPECNVSIKPQSSNKSKSYVKIYNRLFPFQIRKNFTTANSPRKNSNSLIYSYEAKKPLPFIKNDIFIASVMKKSHSLLKEDEASQDNFPNREKTLCNNVGITTNNAQNEKQYHYQYDNKKQSGTIDEHENKLSSNIFQLLYTRLTEIRQIKNISSSSLIEALIDAFDCIGCNINSRFKKCCELLKQLHEKINHTTIINSHSSTAGSSAHSNHDNISEQLWQAKKDLKLKEYHLKSYLEKINEAEKNAREKEILINSINKKYLDMKTKFILLKDESKVLKTSNKDLKSELDFLREKEFKMMEVMYLLQKKGISIDEVMKEKSEKSEKSDKSILLDKEDFGDSPQIRYQNYPYNIEEISNTNDISSTTVYFPDKVHQFNTNNIFNNYKVKIPKLDFRNLPGYESHSNNNSDAIKININTKENKPTGDKSQLIITDCQSTSPLNQNHNFIRYNASHANHANNIHPVKQTILNTNKNNFFPMSSSINLTNLQYNDFENDGSLNSTNNHLANSLAMDKNKDYSSANVGFEDFSYSKNKSLNSSNNMNISKLKDSLKNFSLSNASLNTKLKMKQFSGAVKK